MTYLNNFSNARLYIMMCLLIINVTNNFVLLHKSNVLLKSNDFTPRSVMFTEITAPSPASGLACNLGKYNN